MMGSHLEVDDWVKLTAADLELLTLVALMILYQ